MTLGPLEVLTFSRRDEIATKIAKRKIHRIWFDGARWELTRERLSAE